MYVPMCVCNRYIMVTRQKHWILSKTVINNVIKAIFGKTGINFQLCS